MTPVTAPQWAASLAQIDATDTDKGMAGRILSVHTGEPPWVFGAAGGGLELEFEGTGSILIRDGMPTLIILNEMHTEMLVRLVKLARHMTTEGTR